jgi:hypothetical protein
MATETRSNSKAISRHTSSGNSRPSHQISSGCRSGTKEGTVSFTQPVPVSKNVCRRKRVQMASSWSTAEFKSGAGASVIMSAAACMRKAADTVKKG